MEDMINPVWIYAIEVMFNFDIVLKITTFVCFCAILFALLYRHDSVEDADIERTNKIIKLLIIALVTMIVICIFIPSKQTMYTILKIIF